MRGILELGDIVVGQWLRGNQIVARVHIVGDKFVALEGVVYYAVFSHSFSVQYFPAVQVRPGGDALSGVGVHDTFI